MGDLAGWGAYVGYAYSGGSDGPEVHGCNCSGCRAGGYDIRARCGVSAWRIFQPRSLQGGAVAKAARPDGAFRAGSSGSQYRSRQDCCKAGRYKAGLGRRSAPCRDHARPYRQAAGGGSGCPTAHGCPDRRCTGEAARRGPGQACTSSQQSAGRAGDGEPYPDLAMQAPQWRHLQLAVSRLLRLPGKPIQGAALKPP